VKDLVAGDSLVLFNGQKIVLSEKLRIDTLVTVYNFEVEGFHTYYVSKNHILVHNKPKPVKVIAKMDVKIINEKVLEKAGIDAHEIKKEWLGRDAKISRYDLYRDNSTGEVLILQKGGKGIPIRTGEFIKP
jgi:uncharacterized protein YjaZ